MDNQNKPGPRPRYSTAMRYHTITLAPEHSTALRHFGDGNLSEGVRRLVEMYLLEQRAK